MDGQAPELDAALPTHTADSLQDLPAAPLCAPAPPRAVTLPVAPGAPASQRPPQQQVVLSEGELASVARVAGRAKIWGLMCVTIGAVQVLASVYSRQLQGMISYLPAGAIAILMGVASLSVARSLRAVGEPGGDPVHKLLVGIDTVGLAVLIQIVTTVIGALFAATAVWLTIMTRAQGVR
jgi:hypothetical protein